MFSKKYEKKNAKFCRINFEKNSLIIKKDNFRTKEVAF